MIEKHFEILFGYPANSYWNCILKGYLAWIVLLVQVDNVLSLLYIVVIATSSPLLYFSKWFNECGWLILSIWLRQPNRILELFKS